MSREKQIEEIARDFNEGMCTDREVVESCAECVGASEECALYQIAEKIYNAGYRKQSEGEWISVDERLPEESGEYLTCRCGDLMTVLRYSKKHKLFNAYDHHEKSYSEQYAISVTHWMPLPEAPKMKGGE